ncbi:MAG: hypothetical protein V7K53_03745 [Nostoc sp.]|uniref:hypothetical protein n=1 Tax=Nostoc sp. TaxID=1180 RepID=UPI002FF615CF
MQLSLVLVRLWRSATLLRLRDRLGQSKNIAAMVCFTASPLSDFMTGTTIRIDGSATPTV